MKKSKIHISLTLILLAQIIVIPYTLSSIKITSNGFYDTLFGMISRFLRILFGWIPFSIGDVFYTVLFFYILFYFIKWIKHFKKDFVSFILRLGSLLSVLYFCFYLFWGFNYAREPLHKSLGLVLKPVNTESLETLTIQLIEKANTLQLKLEKSDTLKVATPYSDNEILSKASISYDKLAKKWTFFNYKYQSVKFSIYSVPLSYMGYSGYYNPFSGEAQVNSKMPKSYMPFTTCHEIAHQLGFAAEQEANFASYLACVNSDDVFVQYSGYLVALSYSLGNLRRNDIKIYKKLIVTIHPGILKNYKENYDFWKAHQNPTTPLFESIYDRFLKVNKQPKGIKSYAGIVKLLVAYHAQHPLKKS